MYQQNRHIHIKKLWPCSRCRLVSYDIL